MNDKLKTEINHQIMLFWTNLFNHKRTYIKPKKPPKPTQPTSSVWNLQEQIRLSKTITILKRHKYRLIQRRKTQLNKSHA